jgi:hypothetical protein
MAVERTAKHHEAERQLHAKYGDHAQRKLEHELSKLRLAEQTQAYRDALRVWVPLLAANAGHLLNQLLGALIAEMPVPADLKPWDVAELEMIREDLFRETITEMVREVTVCLPSAQMGENGAIRRHSKPSIMASCLRSASGRAP